MSTEPPVLPRQLLDAAEGHLAADRGEAAARALTLFAAHTLRMAQFIRRQPRNTSGEVSDLTAIFLIIVDPHTGTLLAHEKTAMRDPGALGITGPTVLTYTLYVTHTHTTTVHQR